ncbi:MAG: HAMP domain-containing sensor histidine kinase [Bacteroidota bacterium]|nr:HAMP domain-containing sensor histidine kinase [Bacteroidota bacterium]
MNSLQNKRRLKTVLLIAAVSIITISLWYTNRLINKISKDERNNVQIWAKSIHQKVDLVHTTEIFFKQLQNEERKKVELLAKATRRLVTTKSNDDITFYSEIIVANKTIPVVLTDAKGKINSAQNVCFNLDSTEYLKDELKEEFTKYDPIIFNIYSGITDIPYSSKNLNYYYYKDSKVFTDLKKYLDNLINTFFSEVVVNSASVPVIITDSSKTHVITYGNIENGNFSDTLFLQKTLSLMEKENHPIEIKLTESETNYIFYRDSHLLRQFRYFPYVQFGAIGFLIFLAYLLFSSLRKSEQNQVWAGMAKETAHQLGTPLSSLMAWIEMLRISKVDENIVQEIEKDVSRLNNVTERFSKIGSKAVLKEEDLIGLIYETISYIKNRTSKKVNYSISPYIDDSIIIHINKHLFQWVIENLCKNAVDAMNGKGDININIVDNKKSVTIDVTDSGKGIARSKIKEIFKPGYTSKQRGWGLGLSLAQRIVENYHHGKIFVKETSEKGTTFRIALPKKENNIK